MKSPFIRNWLGHFQVAGTEVAGILGFSPSILGFLPVVNVKCNGCSTVIGEKFILNYCDTHPPNALEGTFLLHSDKLLYWDGTRLRYADTGSAVSNMGSVIVILLLILSCGLAIFSALGFF
ncbi:hypothetical protein V6N12_064879 [Hibiscus sabdariffa]|uniref:Uncharacterized protein n=1 Tax=Hibiscus sabdariffa TaxID=183260 RepID=A0ABR2G731_9ROSI